MSKVIEVSFQAVVDDDVQWKEIEDCAVIAVKTFPSFLLGNGACVARESISVRLLFTLILLLVFSGPTMPPTPWDDIGGGDQKIVRIA